MEMNKQQFPANTSRTQALLTLNVLLHRDGLAVLYHLADDERKSAHVQRHRQQVGFEHPA